MDRIRQAQPMEKLLLMLGLIFFFSSLAVYWQGNKAMVQVVLHKWLLHVTVAPELLVCVLILLQVSNIVLLRPTWQCLLVA